MAKVRKAKYIYKDGVYYEVGGDGDGEVIDQTARDAAATAQATAEAAQATADGKPSINDSSASATSVYSSQKVDTLLPAAASATPEMDGIGAVGTSAKLAREDHVHPQSISTYLITDTNSLDNQSITGGAFGDIDIAISKSGYTAIGILDFYVNNASESGTGRTYILMSRVYMVNSTTARMTYRHVGTSTAKVSFNVKVLYRKN